MYHLTLDHQVQPTCTDFILVISMFLSQGKPLFIIIFLHEHRLNAMCLIYSLLLYLLPHAIYWSKTLLFSAQVLGILLGYSGIFIWRPEVGLRSFTKANLQRYHKIVLPTSDKIRRLLMRRMNANIKTMAQTLKSCCF